MRIAARSWIRIPVLLAAVYAIPLPAARSAEQSPLPHLRRFEFTEIHMGLPVRLVLYADGEAHAARAARAAFARVAVLDRMMSDYRPDSEVRALEHQGRSFRRVSPDLFRVLSLAIEVAERTGGAFDPTVGPLTVLWREARRTGHLPEADAVARARARTGWRLLALDPRTQQVRLTRDGMRLDLGGIAKGYILQAAVDVLRRERVPIALAESGGDIAAADAPPGEPGWRIDTPGASSEFSRRAAALARAALATSGPTAQNLEVDGTSYSHVLDPRTGRALATATVARVIAEDGAIADALATAATVLTPDGLARVRALYPRVLFSLHPGQP